MVKGQGLCGQRVILRLMGTILSLSISQRTPSKSRGWEGGEGQISVRRDQLGE